MADKNQKALDFYKKEYERYKKENHPAAKHLKKILDNPENKTNVLKNAIHAHCFDCSHDSVDPTGSHPKKCNIKECPFHEHRPMSGKEKAEKKASKEVAPEVKAQRQANAQKARQGKMGVKEALEALDNVELTEDELKEYALNPLFTKQVSQSKSEQNDKVNNSKNSEKVNPLFTKSASAKKEDKKDVPNTNQEYLDKLKKKGVFVK